MDIFMSTFSSQ